MGPRLRIPDAHPGQELSDEQLCTVFLLVSLSVMASVAALIFLVSDSGQQLVQRVPCLPARASARVGARLSRSTIRTGTPQHIYTMLVWTV